MICFVPYELNIPSDPGSCTNSSHAITLTGHTGQSVLQQVLQMSVHFTVTSPMVLLFWDLRPGSG